MIDVQHPAVRVWLGLMAETIHHKPQANKVNATDLLSLAGHLRSPHVRPLNPTRILIESFRTIAKRHESMSPIHLGGLVTHIARCVAQFIDPPIPLEEGKTFQMTLDHMATKGWIQEGGRSFYWKVDGHPDVILPTIDLPPIQNNIPRLTFNWNPPPRPLHPIHHEAEEPQAPPPPPPFNYPFNEPHQSPQPHQPHNPPPPPPPFDIESAFNTLSLQMHARFDQLAACQRQDREDNINAQYPIYHDYYTRGHIPPGAFLPSWYNPPAPQYDRAGYSFGNPSHEGNSSRTVFTEEFGFGSEVRGGYSRYMDPHQSPMQVDGDDADDDDDDDGDGDDAWSFYD